MIQININHKSYTAHLSQSISSFIPEEQEYLWESTGERVNEEQPVWEAHERYGSDWRWIPRQQLKGGEDKTSMWFIFAIGLIIWLLMMITGLLPFVAGYYAIAIEKVMSLLDKVFVWILGPEDPVLYIVRRIARFFGKIISFLTLVGLVWYFTALWCYAPYYARYGECQANHMRKFFGGIIAIMFVFFYYSWGFGISFLEGLRSLEGIFLIGPLMRAYANLLQKAYNKLRQPYWVPVYGAMIQGYFTGVEQGMPYLMKGLDPLEMAVYDTRGFLKMTQEGVVGEMAKRYDVDKIFKFANYEFLTDEEKNEEFFDRGQKITSRFMKWTLITVCSIFGGGLNILRKVCLDDEIKDLEKKLFSATTDSKMDEKARKALINKIQAQIYMATKRPKINEQCLVNTIETATLSGHATIFWGLIIFVVFMFFRPPGPK